MSRVQHIKLPVGDTPGWELDEDNHNGKAQGLRTVAESFVILQSLKQSRDRWISGVFQKFSSKPRGGKTPDVVPPPHTLQIRGKCDLEIGPHTFQDTAIFEVHYLPLQATSSARPVYGYQPPSSSSWPTTTPYGGISYTPFGQRPDTEVSSSTPDPTITQNASTPLLSSLASSVSITTSLISQVNSAAASNPTLANLLQLAAAGKANPEQLKSLGLLIQSLAANQNTSCDASRESTPALSGSAAKQKSQQPKAHGTAVQPTSVAPQPLTADSQNMIHPYLVPTKDFDLVLEFHEACSDRWIFPRGPVVCERIPDAVCSDILISAMVPFSQRPIYDEARLGASTESSENPDHSKEAIAPKLVTFRLRRASPTIWDTVFRWTGGEEKMVNNRRILEELGVQYRDFLAQHLPDGALLAEVKSAALPSLNTKLIKPPDSASRIKRKPVARKPRAIGGSTSTPAPKRRRPSQGKNATAGPVIACRSCGQTNVPLIMGGLFCRLCADAGKGTSEVATMTGAGLSYKLSPPPMNTGTSTPSTSSTSVLQNSTATTAHLSDDVSKSRTSTLNFKHSPLATNPPVHQSETSTTRPL